MAAEHKEDIESLGHLERARHSPGWVSEPDESNENEFTCRACHLIFARSCLADRVRMLCRDCGAMTTHGELPPHEIPPEHHVRHPCPACGALVRLPEREEVSCGFVCPSCRVHLMKRGGHLHFVWTDLDARIVEVEP